MNRFSIRSAAAVITLLLLSAALHAQVTPAADRAKAWVDHQALAQASWFRSLAWRPVGPVKIGARIEAIAIPPGNTGTIYAGVGSGNLWKTFNNGLTWKPIFEHESAFAIGDVAVSASRPNIVWVGTGEAQPRYAGYAYPGTGVFKSTKSIVRITWVFPDITSLISPWRGGHGHTGARRQRDHGAHRRTCDRDR